MKLKKYLHVRVERTNGTQFYNHLKLSEAHFISQLAQENNEVIVTIDECSPAQYKAIFG